MSVRVSINADVCQGHGRCYALAPEIFAPDDDGHGTVVLADVPDSLEAKARLAVSNCPETAISVVSDT